MWEFKAEQRIFEIAGVKIGGVPGERPTVLVGTIFYSKHKIVVNERTGEFDCKAAEKLINVQQEFSDKTGNPCMLDVVGATPEALIKFLEFTAKVSNVPLFMDGISPAVRIATLKFVKEAGLSDRIVYNTIIPEYKQEELEAMKEAGIKSAVILAHSARDFTSKGRVRIVKELIPKLLEMGVEKLLLDACVIDIPSLGLACKAIYDLKNELGYPSGCGAHNAISTWRGLKTKMGKQATEPSIAAAAVLSVAAGADFVLYGLIEEANYVFPAIAMADAAYGQLAIERGKMPSVKHPLFKIA
jgi:tetrahydromethanopterin S-methyltransferase subunit H